MQKAKKVFIDCGGCNAISVDYFVKVKNHKNYEIHSFEPHPLLSSGYEKYAEDPNIHFYQKAVWISDGLIDFYHGNGPVGNSLIKEKRNVSEDSVKVESIDLSSWICNTFSPDDHITLKLDVEGAEYDILLKMIEDGTISYINKLHVEFHCSKIDKEDITRKHELVMSKLNAIGITIHKWPNIDGQVSGLRCTWKEQIRLLDD